MRNLGSAILAGICTILLIAAIIFGPYYIGKAGNNIPGFQLWSTPYPLVIWFSGICYIFTACVLAFGVCIIGAIVTIIWYAFYESIVG